MKRQAFIKELETMLELEAGSIKWDTVLSDLNGWDSMAAIGFIAMADAVNGTTVVPGELAQCKTVADLGALVHAEGG